MSIIAASDPSLLNPLVSESYGEPLRVDLPPDDMRPKICSIGDNVSLREVLGVAGDSLP